MCSVQDVMFLQAWLHLRIVEHMINTLADSYELYIIMFV